MNEWSANKHLKGMEEVKQAGSSYKNAWPQK